MLFVHAIVGFAVALASPTSEVFDQAKASRTLGDLCASLNSLSDGELAVYDEELDECAMPWLRARLDEYWREKEREVASLLIDLRSRHESEDKELEQIDAFGASGDTQKSLLKPRRPKLDVAVAVLPNIEVAIDPTSGPTYYNGGLPLNHVALTFDDGPSAATTPGILKILKAAQVRATFFSVGMMAARHPDLIRDEYLQGHTVGTHTWSHPHLPRLGNDPKQLASEVSAARDLITKITGFDSGFFRFPYGDRNAATAQFIRAQGMAVFQWNIDPQDYAHADPIRVYENFRKQLDSQRRGIVLLHDTKKQTLLALPLILDELANGRYTSVVFTRQLPQQP